LYAGRYHVPRDSLTAHLANCVRLVGPYLVFLSAKSAYQFFRIRISYLSASWACLFHALILSDGIIFVYEIDHVPYQKLITATWSTYCDKIAESCHDRPTGLCPIQFQAGGDCDCVGNKLSKHHSLLRI